MEQRCKKKGHAGPVPLHFRYLCRRKVQCVVRLPFFFTHKTLIYETYKTIAYEYAVVNSHVRTGRPHQLAPAGHEPAGHRDAGFAATLFDARVCHPNRPETGKRTAPSALNLQDVDIYVVRPDGCYLYDAAEHRLVPVAKGDYRKDVAAGQDFAAEAPVSLVLVSDFARMGDVASAGTAKACALDAGIVSQNISLFCAAANLATVPRMTMNEEALRKALKLKDSQRLMLNHPVGHMKR